MSVMSDPLRPFVISSSSGDIHAALTVPVGPISPHSLLILLLQIGVLGLLALLLGRLAGQVGLPPIVGELCVGVLLGPSVLGAAAPDIASWLLPHQVEQTHLLDAVGQVGVILLVGMTGVEMDFGWIKRRGLVGLRVSLMGLVIPLAFGVAAGFFLPASMQPSHNRVIFALFLGVAMCVSAIPVIAKTLIDMNLLHRNIGQLILTAGMVDDVVGWVLLAVVSAMATAGVTLHTIVSLLSIPVITLLAAVLGRPVVRLTLRVVARGEEPGPMIAAVTTLMILAAAASQALGLEAVFGAFVCGIVVATSGAVAVARLAPLRTFVLAFLAPIFFATAGLRVDLTALSRPTVILTASIILILAIGGKFLGAYLGARLGRLNRWEALALGAGMNARGVIEVIVAMVGLRLGVLGTDMYTVIVLVAIVTSVMAPPILRLAMRNVEQHAEEDIRLRNRLSSPPKSIEVPKN